MDVPELAAQLALEPHPEGGWQRQTWASDVMVTLPDGRLPPTATLIWFLLPAGESSAWHRVSSDEIWLAHSGAVVLKLGGSGPAPVPAETLRIDPFLTQAVVPGGVWQRTV